MMKYYKIFFTLIIALTFSMGAYAEILRGVHITATGNNQYECKIRAHSEGMKQAMSLIADEMGIKKAFFKNIPYNELKSVFAIDSVIEEKSYEEKYTADVNYRYSALDIHELMLKYGGEEVQNQFYDYVVIPVLKQKHVILFLDAKTDWLGTWMDNSEECIKNRLLPLDPTKNSNNITVANIFSKSYADFLNDLNTKRFKNILIASCEYFTRNDGSMYFKVTTEELTPFTKNIIEESYDITTPENAKKYFEPAIKRIIDRYGQASEYNLANNNANGATFTSEKMISKGEGDAKAGGVLDALLASSNKASKLLKVEMRLDVFSPGELEHLKHKLQNVREVTKFQIDMDEEKNYHIVLYIRGSMADLAEGFYMNNLSYKLYDNEYVMFELESGI